MQEIRAKGSKRYLCCIGTSAFCFLLWFVLALLLPSIIAKLLKQQAESGIVMTPATQNLWGHIPGDTQTITIRNFTFFNFTNPKQVLYFNATPVFKEISGFRYYERQDFVDLRYTNNDQLLYYNYWLHFHQTEDSRNPDQKVKIINLAPNGFWYQLKNSDYPVLCIQGLGQLYFSLRDTLKLTAIGQGISQQFLPNYTNFEALAQQFQIDQQTAQFMWHDQIHGLSDKNNYEIWVSATIQGIDSSSSYVLINYFALTRFQMKQLLDVMSQWQTTLENIINNWYCDGDSLSCTSQNLAFRQLSTSEISANPPPGSDPTDTICGQNITCVGFPELSSYVTNVFKIDYPDQQKLFNITFSKEDTKQWFTPSKQPFCILHAGNLKYLWDNGRKFDNTSDTTFLTNIQTRFRVQSLNHTFVFWAWIKYFTKQFVLKLARAGSNGIAGIGGVASQALYQSFAGAQDWLANHLISATVADRFKSTCLTCSQNFVNFGFEEIDANSICADINYNQPDSFNQLIEACQLQYGLAWQKVIKKYNLTGKAQIILCDTDPEFNSLKKIVDESHKYLDQTYNCDLTPNPKCSDFELTLKQWNNSLITLNPIKQLNAQPSLTVSSWNPDIPSFEYNYFLSYLEIKSDFRPNLTEIVDLLSFDQLFSGTTIQEMFIQKDPVKFYELYHWKYPQLLINYLRYLTIEIGFGGFTQQRTVKELVFGYQDDFLKNLRDMDPAMGGDPSINIVIAFNEPNSTREQANLYPQSVYTGKSDKKITRYYHTINGIDTISYNYSYWDGNQVIKSIKSPWAAEDHFIGTDGFQSAPGLKPDSSNNISMYLSTLYRYGRATYTETIRQYDMDLYVARIDPKLYLDQYENPANAIYFQGYGGFLNLTNLNGLPLFISGNHFLNAPRNWSDLVHIYDQQGTFIYNQSIYDDTYLHIQPYSGASFCATIYLQSSYLFTPDELYTRNQTMMLPVFTLWRSGNISANAVDKFFGPLILAVQVKKKAAIFAIVAAGVSILICVGVYLCYAIKFKTRKVNDPLLYSLQPIQ